MLDNLVYGMGLFCNIDDGIETPLHTNQVTPRVIIPHKKVSVKTKRQHVRNLSHHVSNNDMFQNQLKTIEHLNLANYQKPKVVKSKNRISQKRRNNSIEVIL